MTQDVKLSLIVARDRNGVIGKDGDLPWRLSEDLKFFKRTTLGKPVIMGRKTWASLPFKPLPGRANIVLSRNREYSAPGARLYSGLPMGLAAARSIALRESLDEVFVIGGAAIYAAALDLADRIYVTEVDAAIDGDVSLPDFDEAAWRSETLLAQSADDKNQYDFQIRRLDRL